LFFLLNWIQRENSTGRIIKHILSIIIIMIKLSNFLYQLPLPFDLR
jgi:hypothetical protein